ncbi:MAG TPA: branched-chain amino acid ABC transporter permease [Ignavibacteriaceae bacterium]|nr:branched-chain amino acid ABC transporter permease [Ignavibacteriaceae bacterium]
MNQLLANILYSVSIYLLISFSFSLIYYTVKFFHIAHAGVITFSTYCVLIFTTQLSVNFSISVVLAIIAATLLGILCEVLVYRQMRKSNVPALAYLIASLGLYIVLQNCISLYFGDDTKIINTEEVTVGNQIFGAYITTMQITTVVISFSLFIAVNLFLHFSTTGKSIRAVASNSELCNIYSISSNKIILIVFGIGSALAATAGILSAVDTGMIPTFGFNFLLYGVVVMIIGGVGSNRGLISGSLLLATAQHLSAFYIDTKWIDAITYIILIIFLIWKPLGFSGKLLRKVEI